MENVMVYESLERRANPRIEINGEITYYTLNSNELRQGMLENMSMRGARIWIDKNLPTTSQVHFRVESQVEEVTAEFVAILLHALPHQKESLYGYGCIIEETETSIN